MIQKGSILKTIDNSGASTMKCIHVFGTKQRAVGTTGDIILVSVKRLRKSVPEKKVKKSDVKLAVIIAVSKRKVREIGSSIRTYSNLAVMLIKDDKNKIKFSDTPIANRMVKSVWFEVREKGYGKLASMAKGVLLSITNEN